MDFEIAAQRLANDQKSALARSRASRNARAASSKARREAQAAKAKAEARLRQKKLEALNNAKIVDRVVQSVRRVERRLGVTNVVSSAAAASNESVQANTTSSSDDKRILLFDNHPTIYAQGWKLQATSIHGEGDKIALPPTILEALTSNNSNSELDPWGSGRSGRPLAFRIGVLDPEYEGFPASETMKKFVESVREDVVSSQTIAANSTQSTTKSNDDNDDIMSEDSDNDDDAEETQIIEAYLDELSHRYISYTHGTVVEFTQEDGCVGLPEPIARALLQRNSYSMGRSDNERHNNSRISVKRTVDPASTALSTDITDDAGEGSADGDAMDIVPTKDSSNEDVQTEKTPGHLAYGAFDIPDLPIEITPINSLPAGTDCTFTPTTSSIKHGFYKLKDVKAVLEQSLMRTRATLSRGDVIRTWRRGVSFDLIVSSLSPAEFGVVSCVNTDLNVDIGPPEEEDLADLNVKPKQQQQQRNDEGKEGSGQSAMGQGRLLSEDTSQKQQTIAAVVDTKPEVDLAPEPADDKVEGVCNIQIRGRSTTGDNVTGRRRFDIELATMNDLFQYASYICGADPKALRLVTRFPRRVFTLSSSEDEQGKIDNDVTLKNAGLNQKQELFMIEYM